MKVGSYRGVVVDEQDYDIIVSEFKLHLRYFVHFQKNTIGKDMNPLITPAISSVL